VLVESTPKPLIVKPHNQTSSQSASRRQQVAMLYNTYVATSTRMKQL
jgi:hypothetical protein